MRQPVTAHRVLTTSTHLLYGLMALLCLAMLLAASAPPAGAAAPDGRDKAAMRLDEVDGGTLLFRNDGMDVFDVAPTVDTDVHMDVSGTIARVTVRQTFVNDSPSWREAIYAFPLPDNAAVDRLRLRVGERVIEGRIEEKQRARRTYQKARAEGKRAGLVEQERPNIFTTSVANIAPGSRIAVEIAYQQTVRFDAGRFDLRFPLVVGPRYIPRPQLVSIAGRTALVDPVPDADRISPPLRTEAEGPGNPVTLTVRLDDRIPLTGITSPSHAIAVADDGGTWKTVTLKDGAVPTDRDFVLQWAPAPGTGPAAAVYREARDGRDYLLVTLLPRPADTPAAEHRIPPRSIVFVIDTSGSMHGDSLNQAKAALVLALGRLRPDDSFNVIQFNSGTDSLYRAPRPVGPDNLAAARRYVAGLESTGGTNMLPALTAALESFPQGDGKLHQVVFLTDGSIGYERQVFGRIQALIGNTRLFSVGIGSAPNNYFMTRAARFGRGSYTFIGAPSEVSENMDALLRKLERPVLTDIQVNWPGAVVPETWPARVPDLYDGEPLTLSARLDADQINSGQPITITGIYDGQPWRTTLALADAGVNQMDNPGVAAVWARRKIAALMDSVIDGADYEAVKRRVIDTAVAFQLVSKFTSLVAVDVTPARPAAETLASSRVATNLPHGWSRRMITGAAPAQGLVLPRGATAAPMHLAWAAALAALAGLLLLVRRRALS